MALVFKLSRNPRLLEQYYSLREDCFRKELGLPDFDGSEEKQDRKGLILLAVQEGRCVAGVRISPHLLMRSHIQQLGLEHDTCCMWERFVFDPSVRSVQLIRKFTAHLIEVSRESGFQHALILSSLRNARFYRQCHTALGVEFHIDRHVPHSARSKFAGLEHVLSVSNLQGSKHLRITTVSHALR